MSKKGPHYGCYNQRKRRKLSVENCITDASAFGKYGVNFSNGWLIGFKKRNSFVSHKLHGEINDFDIAAAEAQLPILQGIIPEFGENSVYNADETTFYYRRPLEIYNWTFLSAREEGF